MKDRIKKFRDFIGKPTLKDFKSWDNFTQSPITSWFLILCLALLSTFLIKFSFSTIPTVIEEGAIALRDIKADRNYEIVDEQATEKLKQDAMANVLPVYDFDKSILDSIVQRVTDAFAAGRELSHTMYPANANKKQRMVELKKELNSEKIKEAFNKALGFMVADDDFNILLKNELDVSIETFILQFLKDKMQYPIVGEEIIANNEQNKKILLRYIKVEDAEVISVKEEVIEEPSKLTTINVIKELIGKKESILSSQVSGKNKEAALNIIKGIIEPTISFNYNETNRRRTAAAKVVQALILKVQSGEMIIRNGSRFDSRQIKIIDGIRKQKGRGTYSFDIIGTIIFIILGFIVIYYFAERFIPRFKPSRRDYILIGLLLIYHFILMRLGFALGPVFHEALPFGVPVAALIYAIPIAGSAMLFRMLLSAEATALFIITIAVLSGLFPNADLQFIIFFTISNFIAVTAIANTDKRSSIIRAGAITGLVNIPLVIAIKLFSVGTLVYSVHSTEILWYVICAFVGGVGSSMLILIIAPLIESLLGYTTDIKLLELANLNHPLLRELIVRAPGTYHHSHLIGVIGEAAAEAIGANALLVRVASYYHDIGKIKKPLYFVENARNGEDRHAKLSPHMSALIISAHVKDGVEMAKLAKLPRAIIDMIMQHHGKRSISYFFEKARSQKEEPEKLSKAEFEYEGPKPQTREAAILMLADVCEAAVRSLKEKGVTRIQQTVDRVIQTCFTEKQFDECDLTLRDLNEISKAFKHILLGIYHQRIDYQKEVEIVNNNSKGEEKSEGSVV